MGNQTIKEFYNPVSDDNRIFTRDEIGKMSLEEFQKNEDAIMYQYENLGVPYEQQLKNNSDVVFVHEYRREDGTIVKAHYRSKPGNIGKNNLYNKPVVSNKIIINNTIKALPIININKKELLLNNIINSKHEDAKNLTNISLLHLSNIKQETNEYKVIKQGYAKYFNYKYKLSNNKFIPENWKGVYFKENSSLSKNISNSTELKNQLLKFYDLKEKKFKKNKLDICFSNDTNLHRAIGNATILNPLIDKDGYFNALLFDKYDFNLKLNDYDNHPGTTMANNYFMILQTTGQSEKYYIFVPVKFKW